MFISGRTALLALRKQLTGPRAGDRPDPITAQATRILLDTLDRREADDIAAIRARATGVASLWAMIAEVLGKACAGEIDRMRMHLEGVPDAVTLRTLEYRGEKMLGALLADPGVNPGHIVRIVQRIAPVEAGLPPLIVPGGPAPETRETAPLDAETLARHLRIETGDPGLRVTALDYLPGGFGKQTYTFTAAGAALQGDFVLRIDHASGPLFAKDGHFIANEFDLISQLRGRDYPTAEPILAGIGAHGLNGCDMMVVRRSPGEAGGSHLPTDGRAADQLIGQLATLAARLHDLTPPPALDTPGTTLSRELLARSREEGTRLNIAGWRDYWRASDHSPSLALVALYDLLLRIVPPNPHPPRLIHGDFGAHNCMVRDGRLVAVIDWESAHLGEPAEDIAFTIRALGLADDPDRYLRPYHAAGGAPIAQAMLAFHDLMAQVRSLCICNLSGARFAAGAPEALKLLTAGAGFVPYFLGGIGETAATAAQAMAVET